MNTRLPVPVSFLVLTFVAVFATSAAGAAADPPGPRLAFVEAQFPKQGEPRQAAASGGSGQSVEFLTSLVTIGPGEQARHTLFAGTKRLTPGAIEAPAWSGDGTEIAFAGSDPVTKKDEGRIYLVGANGRDPQPVLGTAGGHDPVMSPDGTLIAFSRSREHSHINRKDPPGFSQYSSETTWIVAAAGGKARQLTRWQNGRFESPTSFSPDGLELLLSVSLPHVSESVDAYTLDGGAVRTVEPRAADGAYSPDGSKLAFITFRDGETVPGFDQHEGASELYVADADGLDPHRLTHTPELEERSPSWDPSGEQIAFTQYPAGFLEFLGLEAVVGAINADGTCSRTVAEPRSRPGHVAAIFAPVWEPGPGRAAGPLSC